MNRERAKELLPVIQAFAEGKKIQYESPDNVWSDDFQPDWSFARYRIKPEPRVFWASLYNSVDGYGYLYGKKEQADDYSSLTNVETIKLIEAIE